MVFEEVAFDDLWLRIEPFGDEGEDSFIGLHGFMSIFVLSLAFLLWNRLSLSDSGFCERRKFKSPTTYIANKDPSDWRAHCSLSFSFAVSLPPFPPPTKPPNIDGASIQSVVVHSNPTPPIAIAIAIGVAVVVVVGSDQ